MTASLTGTSPVAARTALSGPPSDTPLEAAIQTLLRTGGSERGVEPEASRAADTVRLITNGLVQARNRMTEALITSQDRLQALRAMTQVNIESLGRAEALDRVLAEALELTESDAVVLLAADGSLRTIGDDLAATELVLLLAAPVESTGPAGVLAVRDGRAAIARLTEDADGALVMGFIRRSGPAFSTGDMDLIESVTSATGMMYTLTRLHLQGIQRATIEREHQFASSLAQAVLDVPLPQLDGVEIYAGTTPASTAGGDFLTFLAADGVLWFAVGDVAGKGLPAAMVMTRAVSAARVAFLTHQPHDVAGATATLNAELFDYLDQVGLFVTAVIGAFDPATGQLFLCNAGHSPVLTLIAGRVADVPPAMPPLGVLRHPRVRGVELLLGTGDALVLGSDGLAEQESPAGALFGYDRLRDTVAGLAGVSADGMARSILAAVNRHAAGTAASDDCTLAVLRASGELG